MGRRWNNCLVDTVTTGLPASRLLWYEIGMAKRRRVPISKKVLAAARSSLAEQGGRARAKQLPPGRRAEIARLAAVAGVMKRGQTPRKESTKRAVLAAKAKRSGKAR